MADLILSAVLPVLFEKLTSRELLNFATQEGVRSKLKKWEKTLKTIKALLNDAEQKQQDDEAVKMWLDDLRDLAFDAEDILDEYATEALRRKLKIEEHQARTSRARKLIPACCVGCTPSALWSDFSMRSKIDDVTRRFEELQIAGPASTASSQRLPTSSLPTEPAIYGRDQDKAKILEMVLSDEPGDVNFGAISIVGMGGVGKTTMAREVYNDEAVKEFNPKGWACVSDDFDVMRISKAILESITGCSSDLKNLDAVQKELREKVAGRKFLLVLDDVWSTNYSKWESLRSPFMDGAQGSKIIVTTRLDRVASTMGSSKKLHRLHILSNNECWSLFTKHAFDIGVMDGHPSELIRQKVIEKCNGLPLATKTLGGLLRLKNLQGGEEIPQALKLSYYHLPPHLKRCYAYCAIFPKDYEFEEHELVLLWMAEGLVQQSNVNKQLEDLGGASSIEEMPLGVRKWECLRTLSNFIVGKDSGSNLKDLEDLEFLCGELHISRLENVTNFQDTKKIILSNKKDLKVLLLEWGSRFDESRDEEVDKKVLDMLQPHQNLEKLTIEHYGSTRLSSWLKDCKKCTSLPSLGLLSSLKSLTIEGMGGIKSIGFEFYGDGWLKPFPALETLCFEDLEEWECWNPVKENESFLELQELSIVNCPKLSKRLPNNLSSLKKLVIRGCAQLVVSLSNISRLCELELDECKKIVSSGPAYSESLESMSLSNISEFGGWSRQEFKKVQSLNIQGCEELIELWQKEIFLNKPPQEFHSLISLRELNFSRCNTLTTLLEGMKQKNTHVEELGIYSCDSLNFIFRGQLPPSLKKLRIRDCEKLQCLLDDYEDSHTSLSSAIMNCSKMFPFPTCLLPKENVNTTTLTILNISGCSKLTTLSLTGHLPMALKHLHIKSCSELITILPEGQLPETLETLAIWYCPKLKSIVDKFHNNKALKSINIMGCDNLESLPEGLHTLSSLIFLVILDCPSFTSFPEGGFPNNNLRVSIRFCEKLKALPSGIHTLNSFQELSISICPNMSLSEEGLPTKLAKLSIHGLKQCKPLMEWGLHNLTSLTHLSIDGRPDGDCFQEEDMRITLPRTLTELWVGEFPKLKSLPFRDFEVLPSLESLKIYNCPELTSLPNPPSSLKCLQIIECPELISLASLPSSLLQLYIRDCPLLKEACKRDNGKEWSKIADIPCVEIDQKFIYDPEEASDH
ncbi:hypothetical protein ACOSQ2_030433 [Xanthoceras sorbifolium]